MRGFIARLFQRTGETIGVQSASTYSEEFMALEDRVDRHREWQEELAETLWESVDRRDKSLLLEVTDLLMQEERELGEMKSYTEKHGKVLEMAGKDIDSPYGGALTTMSRYMMLIADRESEYMTRVQEQFIKRILAVQLDEEVLDRIEEERKTLLNRRLDVDAARIRFGDVNDITDMKEAEAEMKEVKGAFEEQMTLVEDLLRECDRLNTEQIHLLEDLAYAHRSFYNECGEVAGTMCSALTEYITMTGIRRPRVYGERPSGKRPSELDSILAKIVLREQIEQGLAETDCDAAAVEAEKGVQHTEYGTAQFDPLVKIGETVQAEAVWDFVSQSEDELSVKAGSVIKIWREQTSSTADVWVMGRIGTREGKVPVTYLKLLTDDNPDGSAAIL